MPESSTAHVIQRIRSHYNYFSDKEKLIADYILNYPQKIIHLTINQIAENLQIADATVFRFCKRIGFKGYQAMKIALASEVMNPIQDIHETISATDSEEDVALKVFKSNMRALEETVQIIRSEQLKKAIHYLTNAERIEFYGSGGSGIIALDAQHKFMRTGIPTSAYTDSHMQLMSASQLTDKDAVILISHSGSNRDILEVLDVAKENGAKTIGITNFAKSPFSKQVDVCLFTVAQETEYRSEALASRIAELSVIDALYVNVTIQKKTQAKDAMQKLRNAISRKKF